MNVFEQENNSGSQINPENRIIPDSFINIDSQINYPILINYLIWPTLIFHCHDLWILSYSHNQQISSYSQDQHNFQWKIKKNTYHMTGTQNHHSQTRHWRKRNAIRINCFVKTGNMTLQTHLRSIIPILQMTVIADASDSKGRKSEKWSDQIMRNFNGKFSDDSL